VRPGSHAAGDGSFGRSAGIQVGRAVVLVAIAVLVGVLLLYRTGHGGGGTTAAASTGTTSRPRTTTTKPAGGKTPVTLPVVTTTTTPARPASAVKVLVANGSSVRGLAGVTATRLHTAGYNTLNVVNATRQVTTTVVYYTAGYQLEAGVLAQVLGVPATSVLAMATPPPVINLGTANVLVIAGPELARGTASTATTLHTTTTVHPATTTTVKR
jgi:hypothetical protein